MDSDQWAPAATPSSTPSPSTAAPAGQTGMPTATEDQKGLAAVSYIFLWITGLIMFFVAKKEQRYVRWNAVQAIGIGIVAFALSIILSILEEASFFTTIGVMFSLFNMLFTIGIIVVVVLTAVKAYQGTPIRLPVIADFADKYA